MFGDIEVRVKRHGKTIATILRPLRELEGRPAVTFKGELRLVIEGAIEVGEPEPAANEVLEDNANAVRPPMPIAPPVALPPEKEDLRTDEETWQDDPVAEPPDSRLIVDAGPGTGKTHAACARVAAMVNSGIPPTRICLVSFTRTAVVEIRNRIARALSDPADAASVRIFTLDAYAWGVQSGFSHDARLTGSFDDNINEAHRLIRKILMFATTSRGSNTSLSMRHRTSSGPGQNWCSPLSTPSIRKAVFRCLQIRPKPSMHFQRTEVERAE